MNVRRAYQFVWCPQIVIKLHRIVSKLSTITFTIRTTASNIAPSATTRSPFKPGKATIHYSRLISIQSRGEELDENRKSIGLRLLYWFLYRFFWNRLRCRIEFKRPIDGRWCGCTRDVPLNRCAENHPKTTFDQILSAATHSTLCYAFCMHNAMQQPLPLYFQNGGKMHLSEKDSFGHPSNQRIVVLFLCLALFPGYLLLLILMFAD